MIFSAPVTCNLTRVDFGNHIKDLGFLRQSTDDDKNWTLTNTGTPSAKTGPSADHTTGFGYYAFLETSGIPKGSRVRLDLLRL
jgi:hypothetical protein